MEFIHRIGIFFLWVGAISLLLFFFSAVADSTNMNFLIAGFVLIVFGMLMWFNNTPERPKSNRFRLLKSKKSKKNDSPKPGNRDAAKPQSAQKN